ncbi:hypothetical protein ABID74_003174 [Gordonia terrae]
MAEAINISWIRLYIEELVTASDGGSDEPLPPPTTGD